MANIPGHAAPPIITTDFSIQRAYATDRSTTLRWVLSHVRQNRLLIGGVFFGAFSNAALVPLPEAMLRHPMTARNCRYIYVDHRFNYYNQSIERTALLRTDYSIPTSTPPAQYA